VTLPAASTIALRTAVSPASKFADRWRTRLAGAPVMAPGAVLDVGRGDAVVVAVAHPDDESLGMGASLARLAHDGVDVHVVAMTAGEAALDHVGIHPAELGLRRRCELSGATEALGVTTLTVLDLPDGRLGEYTEDIEAAVGAALVRHGGSCVATLWRHDPHPDHQAVARASLAAAESGGAAVVEFGLWATHWTDPEEVGEEVVLLDPGEPAALARGVAIACHESQSEPLVDGLDPVLPTEVVTWSHEYVVRPATPPRPALPDFDAMYAADHDPWDVESSWYERRKLAILLGTLPRERYARAWEPGCGPGVVSAQLAGRVGDLVASDASAAAVGLARRRAGMPSHVRFVKSELPEVPVEGTVDLLVVAEFLYYVPDLPMALDALWSVCEPGTHVVFLHWAHRPHDARRGGPEMHARICLDSRRRSAVNIISHTDQDFLLDVYEVVA
jgi:LmbE family N-acetylglucosaminyl deacetylase